jgi:hypothetical protein
MRSMCATGPRTFWYVWKITDDAIIHTLCDQTTVLLRYTCPTIATAHARHAGYPPRARGDDPGRSSSPIRSRSHNRTHTFVVHFSSALTPECGAGKRTPLASYTAHPNIRMCHCVLRRAQAQTLFLLCNADKRYSLMMPQTSRALRALRAFSTT